MNPIKFKLSADINDEKLAKIVAKILLRDDVIVGKNGCWALGSDNNWWLRKTGKEEYELKNRYGCGNRPEVLQAIRTLIIYLLGAEDLNK
ncbi:MAG: hypothetical protein A2831_00770 [Candidatus Yanofskybacteria bacterium RIFCSPHIGHO2_01_FULL_44_17]|uniref:Uncharacterized protein n=1 Tax=Candidatus Yanofskybacteria bacterium RIFCSPHIGHO2_01_FULL_44_17 TaxID=1802668 RepID=A0A1F8EW14_9BACT|nr:MAG: hypothetical protein A2831_00770 [Candidatus Yanofskybacteria bacterium RIFCSPHIGHO2_01_FULL_44_17]